MANLSEVLISVRKNFLDAFAKFRQATVIFLDAFAKFRQATVIFLDAFAKFRQATVIFFYPSHPVVL